MKEQATSEDISFILENQFVRSSAAETASPKLGAAFDAKWVVIGISLAVVAVLALVPFCFMIWQSFHTPETATAPSTFTLDNYVTAAAFGLSAPPFNIYSMWGMIWVDGLHYSPMAFLLMSSAFRAMDPSLEESAVMSGSSILNTLWRITLKLAFPAIVATVLTLFVRAIESFEVPALLGLPGGIQVFTSAIYQAIHQYPSQIGLAASYSVILLLLTTGGIYVQARISASGNKYATVTGKGFRPRTIDLGVWRFLTLAIFIVYFLLIVILPFLVLLW
ncbi:MAG: iron ABC transporter permease, partial [Betaproteobacteria bacterium]|nr:iron ABC transporter permease [Betaproteobacteria bacterium]